MIGMVKDSVLGLGFSTSNDPCGRQWCGLTPVGTGARSEEGAASTKEVSAGEGGGKARVGRSAAKDFNGFRLGSLPSGRETRTVSG